MKKIIICGLVFLALLTLFCFLKMIDFNQCVDNLSYSECLQMEK